MNAFLATLAILVAPQAAPLDTDFEAVLGKAGLSTRTARFDESVLRLFRQGEFTSPLYDALSENPWRAPFITDVYRRQIFAATGKPNEGVALAGQWIGAGTRRTLVADPIQAAVGRAGQPDALKTILERLKADGVLQGDVPNLRTVPAEVQQAAALVLAVTRDVLDFRRAAFSALPDLESHYRKVAQGGEPASAVEFDEALRRMRAVDLRYLGAGAHDLLMAVQSARVYLDKTLATETYDLTMETVWGKIRLSGGRNDVYDAGPYLLIVDTGGDDRYVNAPANLSSANWASVVLDTHGKDAYLSDPALAQTPVAKWDGRRNGRQTPGPAGALFGYAFLLDAEGDDLYRTHRPGLASGRFGVAALLDQAGNDVYEGYADGLGFGQFGIGLLEDLKGDDAYEGFSQVEGCGQTGGAGLLIDRSGNDRYVANDSVIDFASPQSAEHNVSMSQGAGNGLRADYTHGHSLSGGVGLLCDVAGDDTYVCGVFGQGVGYWKAVGMLWDGAGKDAYLGQWYVQGASAHFALGYLEDEGDSGDTYTAMMNMAQGAGHDFGWGMLLDRGGDDAYRAPNLSLGAGNANGLGVFVDFAGDDKYDSKGTTLGMGAAAVKNSLRSRALTLGVFMDLGGQDVYPEFATWAKNATSAVNWTDRMLVPEESQLGVFYDR
ncbi:MAG: hypothetical protein KIS66_05985 [Fimbriimonadaceae bacterium]|nr:hypothetical protein [Fimbriimonadaceae bacterium]